MTHPSQEHLRRQINTACRETRLCDYYIMELFVIPREIQVLPKLPYIKDSDVGVSRGRYEGPGGLSNFEFIYEKSKTIDA